jgi:hypothetical protein
MSYLTQADLADDGDLRRRVTACAALEGIPEPEAWAYAHRWELSAQPGWDAAYEYAINAEVERPGADAAVISDQQILAAVQTLREVDHGADHTGS